jgi:hypothetical protein
VQSLQLLATGFKIAFVIVSGEPLCVWVERYTSLNQTRKYVRQGCSLSNMLLVVKNGNTSGSEGGEYEDGSILGVLRCVAGRSWLSVQRRLLP